MPERTSAPMVTAESVQTSLVTNPDLDRLTRLVCKTLHVPMSYGIMLDHRKRVFVSAAGVSPLALAKVLLPKAASTNGDISPELKVEALTDTSHASFLDIAAALGAKAQLAVPLILSSGNRVGTLCALDTAERHWQDDELTTLKDFAQLVITELELTFKVAELETVQSALAEKHEVLRTLIDTSPDYIFVKDAQARFVISNRAHAHAAGINDPDLLTGKTAFEMFPSELAEQYNSDDKMVIDSGEALINVERQTLDSQGARRWVLTTKVPLKGAEGSVRGLVGISRDITARKMAEATLRDREAFIQQVIAASPALIYIYDLVENRNTYSNIEIYEVLGYTPEEIRDLGSALFLKLMHPEDFARLPGMFAMLAKLPDGQILENEYRLRHRDGEYRWLYSRDLIFKRDALGKPLQSIGTILDISRIKKAEAALRESEAFNQKIMATSTSMIFIYDLVENRNIYSNAALWEVLGYTPAELREMGSFITAALIHPDDLPTLVPLLARLTSMSDQEVADIEHRVKHRNGEYRWLFARFAVFKRDDKGKVCQVMSTVFDITEKKNAEAALRDSEVRTRTLVNAAPLVLIQMDIDGTVVVAEGEGIRRLGWQPERILGSNGLQTLSAPEGPESRLAQRLESALQGETADLIHDNESAVFHLRISPLFDPTTSLVSSVMIVGADMTEQIRARDAVMEINGRLSRLRKIDIELTSRLDLEHVIETALRSVVQESGAKCACLALVEGEELRVHRIWGTAHAESAIASARKDIMLALRSKRIHITWSRERKRASSKTPEHMRRVILPLVYGEQVNAVIVLEDFLAQRQDDDIFDFLKSIAMRAAAALENARLYGHLNQLYERVSALEQLKTDMIRIAAHDLRNPLTGLKGYLSLLSQELRETLTPRQQGYLAMLDESVQSMQRIISEILSLQRIEALQEQVEHTEVDLATLVRELALRHEHAAAQKQISFRLQVAAGEGACGVLGDEAQLREAIDNLIHNALKYTPEGGEVSVRLYVDEGHLHFEVQDNGYGIPAELQTRLFQPFYRARTSNTRHIEGTGLGLHLVKKIIERHSGQMRFSSEEGTGSIFGFTLPLPEDARAANRIH